MSIVAIKSVGGNAAAEIRGAPRDCLGLVAIFKITTSDALKQRRSGQ